MFEAIVTIVVVVGFAAFLYKRSKKKSPTTGSPATGDGGGGPGRGGIGINEHIK